MNSFLPGKGPIKEKSTQAVDVPFPERYFPAGVSIDVSRTR